MAEAVVSVAIERVLSTVISLAAEQINLAWDFKEDLNKLHKKLEIIQAFLQDADERQTENNSVKLWLEQLNDIAYEAADVLDELAYEVLREKVENKNQLRRKVRNFISPSNPIFFRYKIANNIKDIYKSLDDLNKLANQLSLQRRVIDHINPLFGESSMETISFMDDSKIVGRENDASKVIELLMRSSEEQAISVMPIVGMAGLGKTTLAKLVYNDADVTRQFDKKFWVCVSDYFDVKRILKQMLDHYNEQISEAENKNAMVEKLQSKLEGKKFLLVLDDVWKVEQWDDLMLCLSGSNDENGSAIIITTRDELVASKVQTLHDLVYHPGRLEHDECWSIIKEKAFEQSPISEELESIGKDIAKRCEGVPLVAKVIGGTMRNERAVNAWLNIQKTVVWDSVESVLRLSYDRLSSPSLKKCFSYCAIFPKDFLIEKEQLVQLWMAEGLLQQSPGSSLTMDEVGKKYFNDLLSCSLFQDTEKDNCGNIIYCKMHDLVHDLASSVSKFETLILEVGSTSVTNISRIRHFNVIRGRESLLTNSATSAPKLNPSLLKDLTTFAPKLHSFFLNVNISHKMSWTFTSLRILNFSGANYVGELPKSLGKMKHLRYLDISKTNISALPRSVTKLYNLQTLRFMRVCSGVLLKIPNGLRNLISLRHLHFDIEGNQPIDIGSLPCLQTLPIFFVGLSRRHRIEELKCHDELVGELRICNLEIVRDKEEAMRANLCNKSRLCKLTFEWGNLRGYYVGNDEEVLENLQPHPNLESLIIKRYAGEKFSSWMLQPIHGSSRGLFLLNNLMDLELDGCNKCKSLPPLGQLQNLKFLTLKNMEEVQCMGDEFYCNISNHGKNKANTLFPVLKRFILAHMKNLREWKAMAATIMFPCLEEFSILECPLLKGVPLMGQVLSLVKFNIQECPNLRSIGDGLATSTVLKELTIRKCTKLCSIPYLKGFSTLSNIYISDCEELEIVPLRGRYSSLKKLHIIRCLKLSKAGDGLSTSTCLQELVLEDCHNLSSLPNLGLSSLQILKLAGCGKLEKVPITGPLPSLETVDIMDCETLNNVSDVLLASSTSLRDLRIQNCKCLTFLLRLDWFSSLQKLTISQCSQLTVVPITGEFSSLRELTIRYCQGLSCIGNGLSTFTCLQKLIIINCPNLRSTPVINDLPSLIKVEFIEVGEGSTRLLSNVLCSGTSLCELKISGLSHLISIPQDLRNLHSLEYLSIVECPRLKSISEDCLGSLTSLRRLKIGGFSEELEEFPFAGLNSIQHVGASLNCLHLIGWEKLKSLPHQIQQLTALKRLWIERFHGVEALPEWLGNLSSLEFLEFLSCDNLLYLPSLDVMQSFSKLQEIRFSGCPQLEKRCIKDSGPEWSKISSIPCIIINKKRVTKNQGRIREL